MALTKEAVDKLKNIHEAATGEKLSDDEAWEMATRLLELAHLVLSTDEGASYPHFDEK
jgi:hypothetical protein